MNDKKKIKIENTFRQSDSQDNLFDAFQSAIENNLEDPEIYKVLLANPALSPDEIMMFTEKLCREFPEQKFGYYIWTAQVFENKSQSQENRLRAMDHYIRAAETEPTNFSPYISLLNLYNIEMDLPSNKKILNYVEEGVRKVHKKSKLYYALANLYKKLGDIQNEARNYALGEKSSQREK